MTGSAFSRLLRSRADDGRAVILDGAMGTALDDAGALPAGPVWSGLAPLRSPGLVEGIHRDHLAAGADILTTCTFRTTAEAFAKGRRPADEWRMAARRAVEIARGVASGGRALVAGSVGPLDDCFLPDRAPSTVLARDAHSPLCTLLVESGVDILWLETFGTAREVEGVLQAASQAVIHSDVAVVLSVTTRRDGSLLDGSSLHDAQNAAVRHGAAAFCVNCVPFAHLEVALDAVLPAAQLPIGAYANLGFADENQDWTGSADLAPEEYAALLAPWRGRGLTILGGCCGTRPAHIRALCDRFGG